MADNVMTVRIQVEFPALEKLVDFLSGNKTSAFDRMIAGAQKVVGIEADVNPVAAEVVEEKTEAKPEKKMGPVIVAPEAEVMPAAEQVVEPEPVKERVYSAEELANAAMKLRDIDRKNAKLIKEKFPEIGIASIGDLVSNVDARKPFAELLISLGAEL